MKNNIYALAQFLISFSTTIHLLLLLLYSCNIIFQITKMIDLLKNYKQLHNAPGYVGTIRYYLAKKKLDTLFIKWLSTNKTSVEELFKKAQTGKLKASQQPNPLFSHHRVPLQQSNLNWSTMNPNHTITPPRNIMESSTQFQADNKIKQRNSYNPKLAQSAFISKIPNNQQTPTNLEVIPQFYFPNGKPLDNVTETSYKSQINAIFGDKYEISVDQVKSIVVDVIGLPNYFSICLFNKPPNTPNANKLTKIEFNKIWKELQNKQIQKRAFLLLSSDKNKKVLTIDDFKKLFKQILNKHPGLQFLKQTPQFQDWYSLCVINRIFFMANSKGDYKMTYRQFKKSNILKSISQIQMQPDINKNKDFFSYEDFYVIYIKFWQLDYDHDFLLTKEELSKYSGYTLSRKTIERVFSQIPKKFQQPQKMTFGDFVWFILSVEDKTTEQIMDLDNNGIITGYELEYFFEEQSQRLAYMDNSIDFLFENLICQMVDMLKPKNQIQFLLEDFISKKNQCGVFINMLTDLNKLVSFEQRDAYQLRNQKQQNPNWTEWDNFVKPQYKRIENATDNDDGGQVLNWQNDD